MLLLLLLLQLLPLLEDITTCMYADMNDLVNREILMMSERESKMLE